MANLGLPIKKPAKNQLKSRNSNFELFYKYKSKESHLVLLIYEYWLVDIQYIQDIKKNKFKLENIIKLSTRIKHIREVGKSLKIGISKLEIKAKEEDFTIANAKNIIFLLWAFYMYMQILIFLATLDNKL